MPRIRKKTSKRVTTHQRERTKKKVVETRKKAKKAAKKNPQWKSKHPKDLGIPNSFPYKAQILAEAAAQRRQEEEDKQRRKEQKRAGKEAEKDAEDDAGGFDGVSSLGISALKVAPLQTTGKERTAHIEDEDMPILMNKEYTDLKSVLDKADVVLQVLDARDPLAYQNIHLQQCIGGNGKIFFVLNKIVKDTCPRETIQSWLTILRKDQPTFLFRSASALLPRLEDPGKPSASTPKELSTNDAVGVEALLKSLVAEANKKDNGPLTVALVGIANSGKSSILNSLLKKSISPIYKLSSTPSGPSTTERALEVTLEYGGKQIHLIDTPALAWVPPEDLDRGTAAKLRAKDVLLRNKGRIDRVKEPLILVTEIVSRANTEDLMLSYNLPAFAPGDTAAFLSTLARARGLVKKHGEVDLVGAARIVLRDWSTGRLPRFATPPSQPSQSPAADGAGTSETQGVRMYADDEELLKAAPLRKEMRKGWGIVRLTPGVPEMREAALDIPYDEEEEEESSDEQDDEVEGAAVQESDEDENAMDASGESDASAAIDSEADEDGDEQSEFEAPPSPQQNGTKRKRPTPLPSSKPRPFKKVAFAPHPPGSKQARMQKQQNKTSKHGPSESSTMKAKNIISSKSKKQRR